MYELIVRAVLNHPWAILPEKLAAIEAVLALRANGGHVAAEDIAAATNGRRSAGQQLQGAVAVLPVYGTIHQHGGMMMESSGGTSTEGIADTLRQAMNDPQVNAVVLDVDSPGGSVYGVDELSSLIYGLRGTKPMVAVANSLMASAAYWLGTAADEVWVTPSGQAGSIGVYQAHVDLSGAYEQAGMRVSYVSAGKYKVEGNDTEPLNDDARAAMQATVDDYYGLFVKAVARNRGTSPSAVRDGYGEGRVLTARAAKEAGLVDQVGTLDEAIGRAAKLARSAQVASRNKAQAEATARARAMLAGL